MSIEIRNWDLVAKAMKAAGSTSSQMYIRAKALAEGKPDPMPTSFTQAPHSISHLGCSWLNKTLKYTERTFSMSNDWSNKTQALHN